MEGQEIDLNKKATKIDKKQVEAIEDKIKENSEIKEDDENQSNDIFWDIDQVKEIPNSLNSMTTTLDDFKKDVVERLDNIEKIIKSIPAPKVRIQNVTEKKKALTEMDLFKGRIKDLLKTVN